jgi:hypothetical protein
MDRLTAFVAIHHMQLRLEILKRKPYLLENTMTPKLQGALQALKVLQHDVEADADELIAKAAQLQDRRQAAKTKTHGALDKAGNGIGDIENFVSALEGSNGAPADPTAAAPVTPVKPPPVTLK